jgi:methionyl-tRNA formyltransferase
MGTPEFAVTSLEYLILNQYELVAVYTQPDKMAGRGRSLVAPPVKKAALAMGLTVMQPGSLKKAGVAEQLADLRPDVIVVTAFGQILPQVVVDTPAHGCINIHPSLLPKYRGVSPVPAAILGGDEFTGVSAMLLDQGLDTGPVLSRAQIPILAQDTSGSLMAKLSLVGAQLLLEVLPDWSRGELMPKSQNDAEATYSRTISKEAGEIDWHLPTVEIWRHVRAFQPWPGCYTKWQGRQLKIIEAVPLSGEGTFEIGQVVSPLKEGAAFGVNTEDGILGILKVQMAGKRTISAADFLRGQRQLIGTILPST